MINCTLRIISWTNMLSSFWPCTVLTVYFKVAVGMEFQFPFPRISVGIPTETHRKSHRNPQKIPQNSTESHRNPQEIPQKSTRNVSGNPTAIHRKSHRLSQVTSQIHTCGDPHSIKDIPIPTATMLIANQEITRQASFNKQHKITFDNCFTTKWSYNLGIWKK